MEFSFATAGLLSAVFSCAIVAAGIANRRSGWRRERTDTVTDLLLLWAKVQSRLQTENRAAAARPAGVSAADADRASTDLKNLGLALGSGQRVNTPTPSGDREEAVVPFGRSQESLMNQAAG